jgi:hypothetical protein
MVVAEKSPNPNPRSRWSRKHLPERGLACREQIAAATLGDHRAADPLLVRLVPPRKRRLRRHADLVEVMYGEVYGRPGA